MLIEFITDVIVGINMVLVFGSVFMALEIIRGLGLKQSYVLAAGWKYMLPAVAIIAVIRTYDFFQEYSTYSGSRLVHEGLYLAFNMTLFAGLMVQFLAIKKAKEGRE
ncbi:MAG: hypothetical protein ABIH22_04825 [Candidatus Margulisiibacteriota bacterium]